jgi:3',5'-cyclic AMP phosphodiesterase CpdA
MGMTGQLRLREDGTFKIVQFTDLHWQNGEKDDMATRQLMVRTLQTERPDLVVLTGDLIFGSRCKNPGESLRQAVRPAEEAGIPWAAVFGNHDDEGALNRAELMNVLREHPHCLSEPGPADIGGVGNFTAAIADAGGRTAYALFFLDSGGYSQVPSIAGYDWIRSGQIEWYARQSRAMAETNGGRPVPSLLFFHIPLPEYEQVWRTRTCYGHRHEKPASPKVNSGLFAAMLETGGALGTFCGHDHTNDYWGELAGIRLCYGRATGYQAYGRKRYPRGARVIVLKQGEKSFRTWVRLADGQAIHRPRKHRPCLWP